MSTADLIYKSPIDQSLVSVDELFGILKRFRIKRESYFHNYYPRRDPVTDELIPFRDLDQYMSQDFVSKITLKKWLKEHPKEGWEWSKQYLARRRQDKNLVYAPSEAELRTLCCPSMPYYENMGAQEGGYYGVTRAFGYKDRYTITEPSFLPLSPGTIIIQDTREKSPILFPEQQTTIDTLTAGDYALAPVNNGGVHVERKSLSDFCGTLSERKIECKKGEDSAYHRFTRELERAQHLGIYVVMMVEANINDAQRFDYLPQTRWVKASPSYILHNLRDLLHQFPLTWQVVFVSGRREMTRTIPKVLSLGDDARRCDLQFAYEQGKL